MKNAASLRYSFLLLVGDFISLVGAFSLAYIFRVKLDDRPLLEPLTARGYIGVVGVLLVFWLIVFGLLELYKSRVYENRFSEAGRLFIGSFIGIQFLIACEYVLDRAIFPARLVMLYGFALSFLLLLLFRTIARALRRLFFMRGVGLLNVMLVGDTRATRELLETLHDRTNGFRVIGVVGTDSKQVAASKHFPDFATAIKRLRNQTIHAIIQTELYPVSEKNDEILTYAQNKHISYRFVPGNSELFFGNIDVDLFMNVPVIAVHQTALTGWGRIAKRLFDVLVSLLLIILLLPVMSMIALLLLVTGRGGVIFSQPRRSRFDSIVKVYKFRTHIAKYNGMSPEQAFTAMGKPELIKQYRGQGDKLDDDPRISRVGKVLRATSLDELPQLFNVLRGDLSLVGPRALVPQELDQYAKKDLILSVKSGITGLAQISGRKDLPFEERRKLDVYYVQNWSFWLDVTILLKTGVQVIKRGILLRAD